MVWLDYAKGICITLVVVGHANRSIGNSGIPWGGNLHFLDHVIYSFHMPAFLILAGYGMTLGQRKDIGGFIQTTFWGLLLPYVLGSAIWISTKIAMAGLVNSQRSLGDLAEIWWQPVDHFWFLYHLLVARVLWAALDAVGRHVRTDLRLPAFTAIEVVLFLLGGLWHSVALVGLGFVVLPKLLASPARFRAATLLLALSSAWLAGVWMSYVGNKGWLATTIVVGLLGTMAVLTLSRRLPAASGPALSMLAIAGEGSLVIYLVHTYFTTIARVVLHKSALLTDGSLLVVGSLAGILGGISTYLLLLRLNRLTGQPLGRWLGFGSITRSNYV